jgi:hypothetical protein
MRKNRQANPAAHPDARGAAFFFSKRYCPRAGGCERTAEEEVVLLLMYAKAKTDNITGPKLKEIRRVLEN